MVSSNLLLSVCIICNVDKLSNIRRVDFFIFSAQKINKFTKH